MRSGYAVLALAIVACASSGTTRVAIEDPPSIAVEGPPRAPAAAPPDASPVSTIPVEMHADLAPMIAITRALIRNPVVNGSRTVEASGAGIVSLRARVDTLVNLVDIEVDMRGDRLTVTAILDLKLRITPGVRGLSGRLTVTAGSTSCGYKGRMARLRLSVTGRVSVVPGPALRFARTGWTSRWERHCRITALDIPMATLLDLPVIRGQVERAVERALAEAPSRLELAGRLEHVWAYASSAHSVGEALWLMLRPEALRLVDVRGHGTAITARLVARARPQVVAGEEPSRPDALMPHVTVGPARTGAHLRFSTTLPHARLGDHLRENLRGADPAGFELESFETYGSHDALVVAVALRKPVRGTVYLVGSPQVDADQAGIAVPDLALTASSRAALQSYLTAARTEALESAIRQAAQFGLDAPSKHALAVMRDGWTSESVLVEAPDLRDQTVQVTEEGLHMSVLAGGKVKLRL